MEDYITGLIESKEQKERDGREMARWKGVIRARVMRATWKVRGVGRSVKDCLLVKRWRGGMDCAV